VKKYRDDVCRIGKCVNQDTCVGLCPALKYVNGKSQSKEVLLSNLINPDNKEFRDYKEAINELAENRSIKYESIFERMTELTDNMESISFYSRRKIAIVILLSLGFIKNDIAGFFHISLRQIFRLTK
jgi:putative NADPH-quinone reductase